MARERAKRGAEPLDPPWPHVPQPFDPRFFGVDPPGAGSVDSGEGT
jgi:hypothetical protein